MSTNKDKYLICEKCSFTLAKVIDTRLFIKVKKNATDYYQYDIQGGRHGTIELVCPGRRYFQGNKGGNGEMRICNHKNTAKWDGEGCLITQKTR